MLGNRRLPLILGGVALLFNAAALTSGLLNDDYWQRALLVGPGRFNERLAEVGLVEDDSDGLARSLSELFVTVAPEKNLERLRAYGVLPWWTYEGVTISFWRPLSSLTHWLDYRLFPDSPFAMHLHNLLWFCGVVILVTLLYRRVLGPGAIAGLAALMYLLEDSSYFPTMWIANRNLLMSVFFGLLTLLMYARWRSERWRPGLFLTPLCLLASVLSNEGGIATFAYLFAYALVLDEGKLARRLVHLAPAMAVVVGWRVVYNALGYGASGGGFYFDPAREPFGYLLALARRLPVLLGGQWTTLPPEMFSFAEPWQANIARVVMAVIIVLMPVILWPLLRVSKPARFWLIGMYASALAVCTTVPMSRSLLFVAVGAFGVSAEFVVQWLAKASWRPKMGFLWHAGGITCVILLLAHVPAAFFWRVSAPLVTWRMRAEVEATMDLGDLTGAEDQHVVVVNAPNPAAFTYIPFIHAYRDKPLPNAIRVLAAGFRPVHVTRTAPDTVLIRGNPGSFLRCDSNNRLDFVRFYRILSTVRGPGHPLKAGQRFALPGVTAEVLKVDQQGLPVEVSFEFDRPLDDASLRWLWWDWDKKRYLPFPLPKVGSDHRIDGPF